MAEEQWHGRAERLLSLIAVVIENRDRQARELERLGIDYEVALSRIAELEALNVALRIELYELKRKPNKKRVGIIAAAISGAAIGGLSGFGEGMGTAAYEEWRGVKDAAMDVAVYCGVPPSIIAEASPDAPRTSRDAQTSSTGPSRPESPPRGGWNHPDVIGAARPSGMQDGDWSPVLRDDLPLRDANRSDVVWFTDDENEPSGSQLRDVNGWGPDHEAMGEVGEYTAG